MGTPMSPYMSEGIEKDTEILHLHASSSLFMISVDIQNCHQNHCKYNDILILGDTDIYIYLNRQGKALHLNMFG